MEDRLSFAFFLIFILTVMSVMDAVQIHHMGQRIKALEVTE